MELNSTTQVRLLDASLHTDVTRYLELLAGTRNQGLRHLTLQDNGSGARELHGWLHQRSPHLEVHLHRILFYRTQILARPPRSRPRPCKAGPSLTTPPAQTGSTCSSPSSLARRRALSSRSRFPTTRAVRRSASLQEAQLTPADARRAAKTLTASSTGTANGNDERNRLRNGLRHRRRLWQCWQLSEEACAKLVGA